MLFFNNNFSTFLRSQLQGCPSVLFENLIALKVCFLKTNIRFTSNFHWQRFSGIRHRTKQKTVSSLKCVFLNPFSSRTWKTCQRSCFRVLVRRRRVVTGKSVTISLWLSASSQDSQKPCCFQGFISYLPLWGQRLVECLSGTFEAWRIIHVILDQLYSYHSWQNAENGEAFEQSPACPLHGGDCHPSIGYRHWKKNIIQRSRHSSSPMVQIPIPNWLVRALRILFPAS